MPFNPRTYRIHHKCLSTNHKFEIDNGTDEILYTVRSIPLSLFHKLSLCEASTDKELIKIHEENLHLHVRYDISAVIANDNNNQHLGTVKRIHGQHHFQSALEILSIYGVYKVERSDGQFGHELKLTTGNKTVVDVTKNDSFSKEENVYHVEISDDDGGDLFLLSLVIVLWYAQRWHHI
jgi:uncharacterized protein YxjI